MIVNQLTMTIVEPQKKSFVAIEENEANENIVITYEIIDPTTKQSLYSQDYHSMSQFVINAKELYKKGTYIIVDESNGTVQQSSTSSIKKPWLFVGPYNTDISQANIVCYGSHYMFASSNPANTKSGCKIDYTTFDTAKQL